MTSFCEGEEQWISRLGNLRNAVRQELIGRQLQDHVPNGSRVLDVGCGQGTQALRLARRGCAVVGVDPSEELLAKLRAEAQRSQLPVEVHLGEVGDLTASLRDRTFEVVCAHGLLMYVSDLDSALSALAARVEPGGLLSVTFRNGAALAFRPGMRRQWSEAIEAFNTRSYVNELGVEAMAHYLDDVALPLVALGFVQEAWYGVRVFTEPAAGSEEPDPSDFDLLVQAEEQAGSRDPYRQVASQIHLLGRRA